MDALVQLSSSSMDRYILYNHHSASAPLNPNHVNGYPNHGYNEAPAEFNKPADEFNEPSDPADVSPTSSGLTSEPDVTQNPDYYDGVLCFLNQMLMEEDDLQNKPCMLHECLALQAAEKSFYDALVDRNPQADHTFVIKQPLQFNLESFGSSSNLDEVEKWLMDSPADSPNQTLSSSSSNSQVSSLSERDKGISTHSFPSNYHVNYGKGAKGEDNSPDVLRGKRNLRRDDGDGAQEGRSTKQLASYAEGPDESDLMYDRVLLCEDINPHLQNGTRQASQASKKKGSSGGRQRGRRTVDTRKEIVDLMSLLTQCGQALANGNTSSAHDLLKKIKQHSSPYGDSTERLAHYFTKAMEARLEGTGTDLYRAFTTRRISAAQTLESYHAYMTASPFHKMSNIMANKSIKALATGKGKLHIIHFGILYGFQWPCFIQNLSLRPGGPPKLRITGIDFPQPGFRPTERIEETGRRLENYCKRFNVPFEYNAIAKKWETIQIEELKVEKDEFVVVNCMYRLQNIPDETVVESSPRDAVLNLIKRINPDMFVHGILNGTYNAPFFLTRFREALFHFSALFDIFEATAPREDNNRLLYEQESFGRDVMNVIACEGTSRVERPETYKQWQARNVRAGFRQLSLCSDIVKEVRAKVKLNYHKDFLVDEDSNWMLQGWKGRVLYALSLWKPVQ